VSATTTPAAAPTVTLLVDAAEIGDYADQHVVLVELVEIVWQLDQGRVRRQLVEMRYDQHDDGSRLMTAFDTVHEEVAEGAAAEVIRQRTAAYRIGLDPGAGWPFDQQRQLDRDQEEEEDPW
jgi:hypothetical protein